MEQRVSIIDHGRRRRCPAGAGGQDECAGCRDVRGAGRRDRAARQGKGPASGSIVRRGAGVLRRPRHGPFRRDEGERRQRDSRAAKSRDLTKRTHGLANFPQQAVWGWRQLPVPVIAAIQGVAFGGGFQLALGADMRFLAPDARMSIMEIKWGLVPDMAGTPILASLVRDDILRELTYTGRIFSAQEALYYGLATRICDDPRAAALEVAREIAGKSPDAIRAAKRMLNKLSVDPGAGAARRIRRAAEADRQREPDSKPCAPISRSARRGLRTRADSPSFRGGAKHVRICDDSGSWSLRTPPGMTISNPTNRSERDNEKRPPSSSASSPASAGATMPRSPTAPRASPAGCTGSASSRATASAS